MPGRAEWSQNREIFVYCAPSGRGLREFTPAALAGMAELVDAPDSKSGFRKEVGVRFPLPAPTLTMTMKYCSHCGSLVARKIPSDDNRERWVCEQCDAAQTDSAGEHDSAGCGLDNRLMDCGQ